MMTPAENATIDADEVFFNGTIHSPVEPYAEAIALADGKIIWLGSDTSQEHLYPKKATGSSADTSLIDASPIASPDRDAGTAFHDLDRDLITPVFFGTLDVTVPLDREPSEHAAVASQLTEQIQAAINTGYGALRLNLFIDVATLNEDPPQKSSPEMDSARRVEAVICELIETAAASKSRIFPHLSVTGVAADGGVRSIAAINAALDLLDRVEERTGVSADLRLLWSEVYLSLLGVRSWCAEAARRLVLVVGETDLESVVEAVELTHKHLSDLKQRPQATQSLILEGFAAASETLWDRLIGLQVMVVLTAAGGLAHALRAGIPTAVLPSTQDNPWGLIRTQVQAEEHSVPVRAGFSAQTRAALRVLSGGSEESVPLQVGSDATFTRWRVHSLAVQNPHSTVAAWSTDARARTPLLPYFSDAELPEFSATLIGGYPV